MAAPIETVNPNRAPRKGGHKAGAADLNAPRQMTRREREEVEAQAKAKRYEKDHLAGKTEEAQADMARLALVRKNREEQAKKRIALEEAAKAARK